MAPSIYKAEKSPPKPDVQNLAQPNPTLPNEHMPNPNLWQDQLWTQNWDEHNRPQKKGHIPSNH